VLDCGGRDFGNGLIATIYGDDQHGDAEETFAWHGISPSIFLKNNPMQSRSFEQMGLLELRPFAVLFDRKILNRDVAPIFEKERGRKCRRCSKGLDLPSGLKHGGI
jgi:hypothetical protein